MLTRLWLIGAVLFGVAVQPAAAADDPAPWERVGGWQVYVEDVKPAACFAIQAYEDGTIVRIGFDTGARSLYVMMANAAWRSLEAGRAYPMQFVFDGSRRRDVVLEAIDWNGLVVLGYGNVDPAFAADFVQRSALRVLYRSTQVANLSLRGTPAMIGRLADCQRQAASTSNV